MRKKSMKGLAKIALIVGAVLLAANNGFALSYVANSTGNWSNTTLWVDTTGNPYNNLPGSADSVFIRNSRTVTVSSDVGTITKAYMGDTTALGATGILSVVTGGKLISSGASEVGRGSTSGAYGELNISGGVFQSGDALGSATLLVGVDGSVSSHATGIVTISGTGTFVGRAIVGSAIAGDSGDKFRIVGSNVTVGNTSDVGSNSLEVRASGSVEWIFDAAGISTADFQEVVTFAAGSAGILVDGSAYTGGANTFTLLTAGTLASTAPTIQLVGFREGTTYAWDADNSNAFTITTPIPEPATIGMIGVGALVAMMVRRQMRK